MFFASTTISGTYLDIVLNYPNNNLCKKIFLLIGIFYPTGESISLQRLRCSPFAVDYYSFMGHFLAVAATLTRE